MSGWFGCGLLVGVGWLVGWVRPFAAGDRELGLGSGVWDGGGEADGNPSASQAVGRAVGWLVGWKVNSPAVLDGGGGVVCVRVYRRLHDPPCGRSPSETRPPHKG